ncbi:hypothetical protein [Bradyrhizobium japonicum]|uniref:hypothetical protein n=1 Tax=Bradyrhizobium japonicum TaxID=375 RepID=UPI00200BA218|nr:hypothetical protein [Bradyrhizobium japonicum]UQE03294.1 hypothetical protein JEY30_48020 [Bradyrhizobium japonicum]
MSDSLGVVVLGLGIFLFVVMAVGLYIAPPSPATPQSPPNLGPPPLPDEVARPDVFEQLERLGEVDRITAAQDAKRRRWLRPLGFLTRLLTYAALFLLLYIWAPKDISNTPLATLTLSDIAGTVGFVVIGFLLIRALFSPSDDDQIKDAWGWLGVVLLGVIGAGALYLYNVR